MEGKPSDIKEEKEKSKIAATSKPKAGKKHLSDWTSYGIIALLVGLILGVFAIVRLKSVVLGAVFISIGVVICLVLILWPKLSQKKPLSVHKDQVSENATDDFIFRLVSSLLAGTSFTAAYKKSAEEMRTSKVKDNLGLFLKARKKGEKAPSFDYSLCGSEQKDCMDLVLKCLKKKTIFESELLNLENYLNKKNSTKSKEKFTLKESDIIATILSLAVIGYFLYLCVTSL